MGAIAQLIPILTGAIAGVTGLIKVWADFLKLPIVQTFVRFQTTLKVLGSDWCEGHRDDDREVSPI